MKLSTAIRSMTLASMAMLFAACGTKQNPNQASYIPNVSVAEVVYERLTEWDTFTGRLEAPRTVELRPRVSGYIDTVAFEEGAIVQAGEPLFFIDSRPFKAEVKRLEADLATAKARFELAQSEYQRAQTLIVKNAISEEVLDNRRAQFGEASAQQDAVAASLELARLQLSYTRVEAPITGRVSRAIITAGNFVSAGETVLTNLVSTNKVYAYFDADEQTYLNYVKLDREGKRPSTRDNGNLVVMGLASDKDFPYQGYIDFVDNSINPVSGTIRARAVFDNAQGEFIPGLFARVKLIGSASYEGILIDDKAIGTDLNNKFVLLLGDDNIVQYRAVELGEKVNGLRIIKQGLEAKDKIVVNGLQRVRPGTEVAPSTVMMASEKTIQSLRAMQAQIDATTPRPQLAKPASAGTDTVGG
ncbi:efflux RND transporter periplasmic adaptor subunit [Agarilytica rhodophyticola]|uniref:efflux RND transporter periplasmic adaptor subunit n=1 Tax=Agarilytica rhodophyticola TaxID=1737490 RepID=UPI000B3475D7|nr:efflux RND transporter periplasmic adaptor subunit [Agarilytica rhodophyticola]